MRKQMWLPAILAVLALAAVVGTQFGMTDNDWIKATRTGVDVLRWVGWPLAALGALAMALRTRERAAGLYALSLLINACVWLSQYLGGIQPWAWISPVGTIFLALAMLSWAPGALSRWLLGFAGLSAALHWLYLLHLPWFGLTPRTVVVLDLVVAASWTLFAATAWQGYRARPWRPLIWLGWHGAFSVAMLALTLVQMLFPISRGAGFGWAYLILLPLPMLTAFGFVWSAFPRVAIKTESRP